MRAETIIGIMEDLTTRHKAVESFFSGMQALDFNTDESALFPAHLMPPLTKTSFIDNNGIFDQFIVSGMILDHLSTSRTAADVRRGLDRTIQIASEMVNKFYIDYGLDGTEYRGEKLDFIVVGNPTYIPVVDSTTSNLTGYSYTFTVRKIHPVDCTNLDNAFN